jgi:hypothetical protein
MFRVLLISTGLAHPSVKARSQLSALLQTVSGIELRRSCGLAGFTRLESGRYTAAVLYYHRSHLSQRRLTALSRFVERGGGVLAVHSATASFKEYPDYFRILGGRFAGHGPVEEIRVHRSESSDRETSGASAADGSEAAARSSDAPDCSDLPASFTLRDELYRHRFYGGVSVHFRAEDGEAWEEPVVWSRLYGDGKVFYTAFGHTAAALEHPAVQDIIRRGMEWLLA